MITDPPGCIVEHLQSHLMIFLSKSSPDLKCPVCKQKKYELISLGKPQNYPYITKNYICESCLKVAETKQLLYLNRCPLEELPLWIAHLWLTDLNEESFKSIMAERLGKETL